MRLLIALVILISILSFGSLFFITEFTSPKTTTGQLITINLVYFFLSLFLSLAGSATLMLYWLSSLRLTVQRKNSIEAVHRPKFIFKRSARQAIIFSVAVTGILVLRSLGYANPLNILLLISALILIEVYFFGH